MDKLNEEMDVFDNKIEYYFHEFWEREGLEPTDKIPQSIFRACFIYIYNKAFKPPSNIKLKYNCKTTIDLDNIKELNEIYSQYEYICLRYSIVPFIDYFYSLTGITKQTIYNWSNLDYSKNKSSTEYFDLAKRIRILPKIQVQSKLADDRTGAVVLANNDLEVGLEYNGKRQLEEATARQIVSGGDLKMLVGSKIGIGKND